MFFFCYKLLSTGVIDYWLEFLQKSAELDRANDLNSRIASLGNYI